MSTCWAKTPQPSLTLRSRSSSIRLAWLTLNNRKRPASGRSGTTDGRMCISIGLDLATRRSQSSSNRPKPVIRTQVMKNQEIWLEIIELLRQRWCLFPSVIYVLSNRVLQNGGFRITLLAMVQCSLQLCMDEDSCVGFFYSLCCPKTFLPLCLIGCICQNFCKSKICKFHVISKNVDIHWA